MTHLCNHCNAQNAIVNQCGCDPRNLPTRVPPAWTQGYNETMTQLKEKLATGADISGGYLMTMRAVAVSCQWSCEAHTYHYYSGQIRAIDDWYADFHIAKED